MLWDANRDTDHRSKSSELFQTGQPDGSFMKAVALELKSEEA